MDQPFDERPVCGPCRRARRGGERGHLEGRHQRHTILWQREGRRDLRHHAFGVIDGAVVGRARRGRFVMLRFVMIRVASSVGVVSGTGCVPVGSLAVLREPTIVASVVAHTVRLRVAVGDRLVVAIRRLHLVDVLPWRQRQKADAQGKDGGEHGSRGHALTAYARSPDAGNRSTS